jgi:hypothetical protein
MTKRTGQWFNGARLANRSVFQYLGLSNVTKEASVP